MLLHIEPLPVTRTTLLPLAAKEPTVPALACTNAPLLTISVAFAPLLPTNSEPFINHRALLLTSRTSLDLAVGLRLMMPLAELVRSELSESTSRVNEPLVPTVT